MTELTPKPRGAEAFIYLVEFSDGTLKAGYSATPAKRLAAHRDAGAQFGFTIVDRWVSKPHLGAQANERALIGWCTGEAVKVRRAEYFVGVDFEKAVRFATKLPMERHTDESFAAYQAARKASIDAVKRALFPNIDPAALNAKPPVDDLDPDNAQAVWDLASLAELTQASAHLVLATPRLKAVVSRFLDDLMAGIKIKDAPRAEGVVSYVDYIFSPKTDGLYLALSDPLHEEAKRLGVQLEEQWREELPPRPSEEVAA